MTNPAYTFVLQIVKNYDLAYFGETVDNQGKTKTLNPHGFIALASGIQQDTNQSLQGIDLVLGNLAGFLTSNVQDTLYATGQLKVGVQTHSIQTKNEAAFVLLNKLNIPKNMHCASLQQLWSTVFTEVYTNATCSDKEKTIVLATAVNKASMEITAQEMRLYRVGKIVGNFFNHILVKFAIGLMVWIIASRIAKHAIHQLRYYYIPRYANKLINVLPREVFPPFNTLMTIASKIHSYRFRIYLSSLLIRFTPLGAIPFVGSLAQKIVDLIYLPSKLQEKVSKFPSDLAWRLGILSYQTQDQISASLATLSDQKHRERLEIGGRKAYDLWMNLCEKASREGIPHTLTSSKEG